MNLSSYFLKHFYKYLKQSFPFITIIIIVDLLPLIAIIWGGWSAVEAMYLYALETVVLFWFVLRKMWRSKYILALFVDQTQSLTAQAKATQVGSFLSKMTWLRKGARGLLYFIFVILWVPLMFVQMILISAFSEKSFSLTGFVEHDAGRLDLGFFSLNLMTVFLVLLFLEHNYAFRKKYVENKEYENTGLLNEGLSFSFRVFVQQFVIIGLFSLVGWMHVDTAWMIFIILYKTSMDVISYLYNRTWGGMENKAEGREVGVSA